MSQTRSNDIRSLRTTIADMVNNSALTRTLWEQYPDACRIDQGRRTPRGYNHPVCGYLVSHPGLNYAE